MKLNDPIYNFIFSHKLPVARGEKPVAEYLCSYYDEFFTDLTIALQQTANRELRSECYELLKNNLHIIKNLCDDIILTFHYYDNGKMSELHVHFYNMMQKVEKFITARSICDKRFDWYKSLWRIRQGSENYERKELFHIPMDKRQNIKSYRYSISGYPCLYLASDLELCWYECGMPKEFSYSFFSIDLKENESLHFIDFSTIPAELISSVKLWYLNHPNNSDDIDRYIMKYLVLFPLRVACSLMVENRNVSFVEEYIFPQLLLLWIRENENFDGIIYRSSSIIKTAHNLNAVNVVMPAKDLENNYSMRLNNVFKMTQPVKQTVRKITQENVKKEDIEKVNDYITGLIQNDSLSHTISPFNEIKALCQDFINLYSILASNNYVNPEGVYHSVETLILMTDFFNDNLDAEKEKFISKQIDLYPDYKKGKINESYDKAIAAFREDIMPLFSKLRIRIRADVDYNSAMSPLS